jgi:CubicO group peptidase (beta-lactamase class C family)
VAAIAVTALPAGGSAQTPPAAPTLDDAIAAIAAAAPAAMAYQGTPGLSIAITDRTHTLRVLTFGYANVDAKAPVTPATRFAIGSITKSMTAMALLELHDAGKIDLQAPVTRYLPWFRIDSHGKPILVHQLLSHTAGLPDDFSAENGSLYDIAALAATKTIFPPGTKWSYSNDGFATLGAIVAAVDHRPWQAALQARVFDPLGMGDASPIMTPETLSTAAVGYQLLVYDRPAPLNPALTPSQPFTFVDAAGSVLATPEDMARYMRFYLSGGKRPDGSALLAPATFSAMTHADRFLNGAPAGPPGPLLAEAPTFYRQYGYGLSVFDADGEHLVGHTGGVSGFTSCMQVNLTRGFGVIAMANHVEAPLHPCAIMLYAMAVLRAQSLGRPLPAPWQAPDIAHVDGAAAYAGTYRPPSGPAMRVSATGDHLALIDGGQTIALYPRGDDTFWADDPKYALFLWRFSRDKHKTVIGMNYGSRWYVGDHVRGAVTAPSYPAAWNALVGHYENIYAFGASAIRVVIVRGHLTFDGTTPLTPQPDGTFTVGSSVVRFDVKAGGQPQRLSFDDSRFFRVDLP